MKRWRQSRCGGMSLVEGMFFFVIATLVLTVIWNLISHGTRLGRRAMESVTLQTGIRNVVEYMTRDVAGAYMIAEPNGETALPAKKLVVYLYGFRDAKKRLKDNDAELDPSTGLPGNPYPIGLIRDGVGHKLNMVRVTYEYDADKKVVTQETVAGTLIASSATETNPRKVVDYEFQALGAGAGSRKVLAENVSTFELYPAGYDVLDVDPRTGRGKILDTKSLPGLPEGPRQPQAGPQPGPKMDRTAMVVLKIRAEFDKGADVKKAEDSSGEIITKIWSYPKLYDHIYRPYFSSVDTDLRY